MKQALSVSFNRKFVVLTTAIALLLFSFLSCTSETSDNLEEEFKSPPETSYPGVYWYFMDGNLSMEEMSRDLESMKESGINHVIFLEVGIGVPRGPVDFMSEEWQNHFVHAVRETERLGMKILMGAGPGWCGSGGPWVKPEESMKHLVYSETKVRGNKTINIELPVPEQRSTRWHRLKDPYYEDVAVYAIPGSIQPQISDINEKALYERSPYSSVENVKPYLPAPADFDNVDALPVLMQDDIIDITNHLQKGGNLVWEAPEGDWTIVRMGTRVTGAGTRPAPEPVIGLESNKLDTAAFKNHLKNYTDVLMKKAAPLKEGVGWTGFHMDSWESGSQNWTEGIVGEFKDRRGYDPEPYFLAYTGRAVQSVEITERFLWDLRQTCKEMVLEYHAGFAKSYAHKNNLELTIEPYDMNPAGDLDLGSVADVIMAEFWSKRFGFHTAYAVLEATSISHINGQPVVGAEVFTSNSREAWQEYPWSMKDQSDWALALGVNRFVYHTFAHKPLGDEHRPGMTMGIYGVHWDRGQTWWPMVDAYHKYISRCSHMMQQGQAVSDILYLTPEGAPMVFTPPEDALKENAAIPDKKGYGFDGCSPKMLMEGARVENGIIVFPGASSYEIMVLPGFETMTPKLLKKITSLVEQGAKIIGSPPIKSPSLSDYPDCDKQVKTMAENLWGSLQTPDELSERNYGKGMIYWGGELNSVHPGSSLYPSYESTAKLLAGLEIEEDFKSANNSIRFGHRRTSDRDIYFIANRTGDIQKTSCTFRASGEPELWSGVDGSSRKLKQYSTQDGVTSIDLEFVPYESYFVVFNRNKATRKELKDEGANFASYSRTKTIEGTWDLAFDPQWGGPENIQFDELQDWTNHESRGIKYYSGIASYKKTINIENLEDSEYYIDLGVVNDIARVKLNGIDMGVIWCAPWRINISAALKEGNNELEIEVANRWVNRLLGDRQEPDANGRTVKFENGLLEGKEYSTGRYTFTTEAAMSSFDFREPLPSGLLGPVEIVLMNSGASQKYSDGRPEAILRMDARDHGIVLRYGDGPAQCDILGARDVWVFEAEDTYYMHYDAAGPTGWLSSLAVSKDLVNWEKRGPILDFGEPGENDEAAACYGVTFYDDHEWHMFYLGTPNVSAPPDLIPSFPYLTMKAKGKSPAGPWIKQKSVVPFSTKSGTYYSATASPGHVIRSGEEYLQFFSSTTRTHESQYVQRTLGIARCNNLDGSWSVDPRPMVPVAEQIENSSLYYEQSNKTWFLFTNHIGIDEGKEYTDAIWVYWSKDLNNWNPDYKAIVLDGQNCKWSGKCIGLPSVIKVGRRLAIFYDAPGGQGATAPAT